MLPTTSAKGLWFYTGLAALILGGLIVSPFYTKPADAIAYASAGLVGLLAVNAWFAPELQALDRILWSLSVFYVLLVILSALFSMASSCAQPVHVKLNDREEFMKALVIVSGGSPLA